MSEFAVSADGVPVCYEVHGDGSPPLALVHGWCCDRSYWDRQVGHFSQRHKVVTIDLAGHGESGLDRKAFTMESFGDDVVAVVDKLGLEHVVLVGHSMGGPVIIEAARRMPDRVIGLVGIDTFRDVELSRTGEQIDEIVAPMQADFVKAVRSFVRETMFVTSSDPGFAEQVVGDMAAAPPEVGISAIYEFLSNDASLRKGLREVKAPIFAIISNYRANNIEGAQRHGIEVALMSGVGHFSMMEDPTTFNTLLGEVVNKFS